MFITCVRNYYTVITIPQNSKSEHIKLTTGLKVDILFKNSKGENRMSKKKKIIVASICAGVLVLGAILAVVLINIKRFSTYTTSVITYNDHTLMVTTGYGTTYHTNNARIYENGTQIIEDNQKKLGLYSYTENRVLITPEYDSIEAIESKTDGGKTYFLLKYNDQPNNLKIVDENGKDMGLVKYDSAAKKAYTYAKEKSVIIKEKRGKITTKEGKFECKKVYISSVSFDDEYKGEKYDFETWNFETEDGEKFTNIYDLNKDRELVQSMGIDTGLTLENTSLSLQILENGDIRFVAQIHNSNGSAYKSTSIAIYDQNYNLKNESTIDLTNASASVIVGDKLLIQTKEYGSETDYTYRVSGNDGIEYYKLTTYTIDLKNGKLKTKKFNYILNTDTSKHNFLNQNTAILDVQKIKDRKVVDTTTYLLINNRLQTKEIDFTLKSLTKISNDRFIAKTSQSNYMLINNKYKSICEFRDIDSYFTTSESVIITKDQKTYVCNLDGLILKTYDKNDITNIHHDTYYMVKEESVEDGKVKTEYYLERLGVRNSNPISSHIAGEENYYSNGETYTEVKLVCSINSQNVVSLVMTINKIDDGNYTYKFFNFDGDLLTSVNSVPTATKTLAFLNTSSNNYSYSDDYSLVTFDGVTYMLDR